MRRVFTLLAVSLALAACNGGGDSSSGSTQGGSTPSTGSTATPPQPGASTSPGNSITSSTLAANEFNAQVISYPLIEGACSTSQTTDYEVSCSVSSDEKSRLHTEIKSNVFFGSTQKSFSSDTGGYQITLESGKGNSKTYRPQGACTVNAEISQNGSYDVKIGTKTVNLNNAKYAYKASFKSTMQNNLASSKNAYVFMFDDGYLAIEQTTIGFGDKHDSIKYGLRQGNNYLVQGCSYTPNQGQAYTLSSYSYSPATLSSRSIDGCIKSSIFPESANTHCSKEAQTVIANEFCKANGWKGTTGKFSVVWGNDYKNSVKLNYEVDRLEPIPNPAIANTNNFYPMSGLATFTNIECGEYQATTPSNYGVTLQKHIFKGGDPAKVIASFQEASPLHSNEKCAIDGNGRNISSSEADIICWGDTSLNKNVTVTRSEHMIVRQAIINNTVVSDKLFKLISDQAPTVQSRFVAYFKQLHPEFKGQLCVIAGDGENLHASGSSSSNNDVYEADVICLSGYWKGSLAEPSR